MGNKPILQIEHSDSDKKERRVTVRYRQEITRAVEYVIGTKCRDHGLGWGKKPGKEGGAVIRLPAGDPRTLTNLLHIISLMEQALQRRNPQDHVPVEGGDGELPDWPLHVDEAEF